MLNQHNLVMNTAYYWPKTQEKQWFERQAAAFDTLGLAFFV